MKVEIEIVTGFIGAGKTAFINSLVKQTYLKEEKVLILLQERGNTCVTVNEIVKGNVHVMFFKDNLSNLNSFIENQISKWQPNRIIIEKNGTDRIEDLYDSLQKAKKIVKIRSIYFIADAKTLNSYISNMEELIVPSIGVSNLIVLNNCLTLNKESEERILNILQNININGHILLIKNQELDEALRKSKLFSGGKIKSVIFKIINKRRN